MKLGTVVLLNGDNVGSGALEYSGQSSWSGGFRFGFGNLKKQKNCSRGYFWKNFRMMRHGVVSFYQLGINQKFEPTLHQRLKMENLG